jgi:hypothetical protein
MGEFITYFDLANSYVLYLNQFLNGQTLNQTAMDNYTNDLFSKLSQAKFDKIILGFAQLKNLNSYGSAYYSNDDPDDDLMHLLYLTNGLTFSVGTDFLDYLVKMATKNNLKVGISFGGMEATTKDMWDLRDSQPYSYASLSSGLASFFQKYNLDEINFFYALQLPLSNATSSFANDSTGASISSFFSSALTSIKNMSLTIGIDPLWHSNYLSDFFSSTSIQTYFSSINFINFDFSGSYYLDPVVPTGAPANFTSYSFPEWIDVIGASNTHLINVGFFDKVQYASPSCNGGNYESWSSVTSAAKTQGEAAALIYQSLLSKLNVTLGDTFIYPTLCPNNTRYKPVTSNGTVIGSKFVSKEMVDFINKMKST